MTSRGIDKASTQRRLDEGSRSYYFSRQQTGIDNRFRARMIGRCLEHLKPPLVLELGFMDGQWTDAFVERGCRVHVIEGAERMVTFAREKYRDEPRVRITHSLFEDFAPDETYDTILMGGMLKHVDDPDTLLVRARSWLTPGGVLIATTPNPFSMHRRIGTYMGILESPDALTEMDKRVRNLRHYGIESFRNLLEANGYAVSEIRTSMLKVVTGDKMGDWDDKLLDALDRIADEIPEYGWYIYAICRVAPA